LFEIDVLQLCIIIVVESSGTENISANGMYYTVLLCIQYVVLYRITMYIVCSIIPYYYVYSM